MSRIADLFAAGPTLSFEFFPPKSLEAAESLTAAMDELALLDPSFASMTYGALGTTRETTLDVVLDWTARHAFPTMAHLTCVAHSKAEVVDLLDAYAAGGVTNILALGGDPPADGSDPGGDFTHAIELVELVREHHADFSIGVAAHPEKHPRSPTLESDRRYLAEKLDAADFAITQFFWTIEPYLRLVDELSGLDCHKPIIPGVMLFINVGGMRRMSAMNDAEIPGWLNQRADEVDGDPTAVRRYATDVCTDLSEQLLEAGAPGLHLCTLNRSVASIDLVQRLGLR